MLFIVFRSQLGPKHDKCNECKEDTIATRHEKNY